MPITLEELAGEDLAAYVAATGVTYVQELVNRGAPPERAAAGAKETLAKYFPDGGLRDGTKVFRALNDQADAVGVLWIAPPNDGKDGLWWVFEIYVEAEQRGQGYGRLIMEAAETEARAMGATKLGLHVFGDNTVARRLYESLDYVTTDVEMVKPL